MQSSTLVKTLPLMSCDFAATGFVSLDGVFQVFRAGTVWTVLHTDGPPLHVPGDAIGAEQVAYLRAWAHRRGAALRA